MASIEIRLALARERIERFHAEAEGDRLGRLCRRPLRHRIGGSIVRLGRFVYGDMVADAPADATTTPAWLG